MTSTPIFDALAEEFDVVWQSSGEIPAQAGRPGADTEKETLSGDLR